MRKQIRKVRILGIEEPIIDCFVAPLLAMTKGGGLLAMTEGDFFSNFTMMGL